jgi:hypothetical protein
MQRAPEESSRGIFRAGKHKKAADCLAVWDNLCTFATDNI